jgi:hypothetical protein
MQFFYDPTDNNQQYAFDPDVIITGAQGSYVFTTPLGAVLGPYPSTLVQGMAPPPAPTTPGLAQQANTLVNNGITITSVSTPSLNGTYAVDATSIPHFMAEFLSLVATSAFCDGTQSVAWPDTSGVIHNFTVAQFKPFALAASAFVAGALKCINGSSTTLPPASATIP